MTEPRVNPFTPLMKDAINTSLRNLMVCLPGKVIAFDPDSQMAQVECGIQKRINGVWRTIPVIDNVRVQFAGNDEWYVWHEVTPGAEGLIHFSQRAVDTWNDQGGPVAPHELRMFSAEDAYFVPGIRSTPRIIPGFVNEGVGLSSYDGETRLHLTPGKISLKAAVIEMDADSITQNASTVTVTADVATEGALTNNGVNVGSTHRHGSVQGGTGTSGVAQ